MFLCALIFNYYFSFASPDEYTLKQAVQKGYISVSMKGSGGHYGQCMVIDVDNYLADTLQLSLGLGMRLVPVNKARQDMIVTKSEDMQILPYEYKQFEAYAMCGEMDDGGPGDMVYHFGQQVTGSLYKVVQVIEKQSAQDQSGQYAVWAVTDGAKYSKLRSKGADDGTLKRSERLLKLAKVPVSIFREPLKKVEKIVQEDTQEEECEEDPSELLQPELINGEDKSNGGEHRNNYLEFAALVLILIIIQIAVKRFTNP